MRTLRSSPALVWLTVIVLSILALAPSSAQEIEARHFRRGDCNTDGRVDVSDAVAMLMRLFTGGDPPACLDACDVSSDARFDLGDVLVGRIECLRAADAGDDLVIARRVLSFVLLRRGGASGDGERESEESFFRHCG